MDKSIVRVHTISRDGLEVKLQGSFSVDCHIGEKEMVSGHLTTQDYEGGKGLHYAVLRIGKISIFTPSGADPTRDFLITLRDEINKIEQEIPVVEVAT